MKVVKTYPLVLKVAVSMFILFGAGSLVSSGAQEAYAQGGSEDGAMYQSLIDSMSRVEIHGFVSQGFLMSSTHDYLFATTSKGDFRFNEIGINFSTSLTNKLHVGLQLFSRSLGFVGGNQIQLDWAYADYRYQDWLGLRVGKIKSPLGMYNEIRDIDQLRTSIILPQSVYPELGRSFAATLLGLGVYGEIPAESMGSISYQLQGGTITDEPSETGLKRSSESMIYEASLDTQPASPNYGQPTMILDDNYDFEFDYTLVGSLFWNNPFEFDGLRFGACLQYSDQIASDGQLTADSPTFPNAAYRFRMRDAIVVYTSLEYTFEKVTFAGEYRRMESTINTGLPDAVPFGLAMQSIPYLQEGFYLLLSYAITDSLEVGTYYSMFWPLANNKKEKGMPFQPDHRAWQQDIAFSARYDIFDFWCVKVEGHYMKGTGDLILAENIQNNDWINMSSYLKENWFLGAIKTSVMF